MRKVKIIIGLIISIVVLLLLQTKVEAKSYYIEEMDIQATILKNGDVEIEQILTYSFDGSYNGIYITIPTQYENKEEMISQINDEIYNVQDVQLKSVRLVLTDGSEIPFEKVGYASNGRSKVYTEEEEDDIYKLKVYCPSDDVKRTFKVNYILKNLCVKHNDIGELYYNFIGGEWECTIEKLKIDIFLPYNTQEIKVWGHGPDNGVSKIINNQHVSLEVDNVRKGKYVAARVVFDKSNIANARKISNLNAYNLIYEDEKKIAKISDAKQNYTRNMGIFALGLLVYWIVLLVKYEKDKKYKVVAIKDDELFEKYNPMIAGCLEGNRCILARDIIAVILNLIDKKNIELELKSKIDGRDNYEYLIKKVPNKESEMDMVEKYVYDWIFKYNDCIDLSYALERMPKDEEANKKFKQLNKIVQQELNKKGANNQSVPKFLRIFNTILFIFIIFLSIHHILYQGFDIDANKIGLLLPIIVYAFALSPMLIMIFYLPISLIVTLRHGITRIVHKITGKKVVTTAITIITLSLIVLVLTILFVPTEYKYIIVDELLICIAMIIIFTDNLMLQNSIKIIEDYSKVNGLKDKIENYTMMEDRDIEQVKLWGKYLAYAVSFGIADKISKRIKKLHLDEDLLGILNNNKMFNYISSDYYFFYKYASLDKKFVGKYADVAGKIAISGGSSGRGGGFSGGGGFSRTEVAEAAEEALSKNYFFIF